MTKVSTSLEVLLKMRAAGLDAAKQAEQAIDELSDAQEKTARASNNAARASSNQERRFASLRRNVLRLAAGFVTLATARRAIGLSNQQEQAEIRLLGVLRGQGLAREQARREQERIIELAGGLQDEIQLFGDEEFIDAAGQLIAASSDLEGDLRSLPERLRTAAAASVVFFRGDLDAAARNLARTLGGLVGELGERLPALQNELANLSDAERQLALQRGLAFDVAGRIARPVLEEAQGQGFARQQAALNRFGDALEDAGDAIKIIILPSLELASKALVGFADFLQGSTDQAPAPPAPEDFPALTPLREFAELEARLRTQSEAGAQAFVETLEQELPRLRRELELAQDLPASDASGFLALGEAVDPEQVTALRNAIETLAERVERLPARGDPGDRAVQRAFAPAFGGPPVGGDPGNRAVIREFREALRLLVTELELETQIQQRRVVDADARARGGDGGDGGGGGGFAPLEPGDRDALLRDLGLISQLDAQLQQIDETFAELAGAEQFEAIKLGDINTEGQETIAILREIAIAAADAAEEARGLAAAEETFGDAVDEARAQFEAGQIDDARRNELVAAALDSFNQRIDQGRAVTAELRGEVDGLLDRLRELSGDDVDLLPPEALRELEALLGDLNIRLEKTKDETAGLSSALGEGFVSPLADFFDDIPRGVASLEELGRAISAVASRIFAERAAITLLQELFGGEGERVGGGGAFGGAVDLFGGALGFASGGLVPGADSGRDDRIIAARGGEFVLRPEVVRLGGVRAALERINAGDLGPLDINVAGADIHRRARVSASVPGFQEGGFVDLVGQPGAAASPQVLPVMVVDDEAGEQIFSARNTGRLAELMSSSPGPFRAALGIDGA